MLIRQEETSPITDAFDKLKLNVAFHGIEEQATDCATETDLLKTYCEETIKLLKKFNLEIEAIERDLSKKQKQNQFKEKLYGFDPLG